MSIQKVIDNAGFITINKRKGVGQTISRSGHVKTALQQQSIYRFTISVPDGLKYSENRDFLEDLDTLDVITEANVDIGSTNSGLSYLTAYQGDTPANERANITIVGADNSELYANTIPITNQPSQLLFKKGDFIQPEGNTSTYRYPYQVTADVTALSVANAVIPVHRPILSQDGVALTSGGFRIGNDVRFNVKAMVMPVYNVIPYDLISFDGNFELMEVIT